jgi:hypothetical protein
MVILVGSRRLRVRWRSCGLLSHPVTESIGRTLLSSRPQSGLPADGNRPQSNALFETECLDGSGNVPRRQATPRRLNLRRIEGQDRAALALEGQIGADRLTAPVPG